jgi:hypothetical protein
VSKGESRERDVTAVKGAGNAVCAVAEDFATLATVAEKGIEVLLSTAEKFPLLGGIFSLLKKCWQAAKEIKKTERAVEKLMRTAAGLVNYFQKAQSTLSKDDVMPLEKALTAVEKFLDQRVKAGWKNALITETANETMNELNEDLKAAILAISCSVGLAIHKEVQQIKELLASGSPAVRKPSDADSIYAYIAVQRPPVITGQAISLNSINVCLHGMRDGFQRKEEASKWTDNGCFPVSLNDGSRASIRAGMLALPQHCFSTAPCLHPASHRH